MDFKLNHEVSADFKIFKISTKRDINVKLSIFIGYLSTDEDATDDTSITIRYTGFGSFDPFLINLDDIFEGDREDFNHFIEIAYNKEFSVFDFKRLSGGTKTSTTIGNILLQDSKNEKADFVKFLRFFASADMQYLFKIKTLNFDQEANNKLAVSILEMKSNLKAKICGEDCRLLHKEDIRFDELEGTKLIF